MTTSSTPPENSAGQGTERLLRSLSAGAVVALATAGVVFGAMLLAAALTAAFGPPTVIAVCALAIGAGLAVAAIDYRLQ